MSPDTAPQIMGAPATIPAAEANKKALIAPELSDSIGQYLPAGVSVACGESDEEHGLSVAARDGSPAAGAAHEPEDAEFESVDGSDGSSSETEFLDELNDSNEDCSENEGDDKSGAAKAAADKGPTPVSKPAATGGTKFRGRPSSCVFVASLAASLSDDDLCLSVTENFRQFGSLTMVKVLRDPANRPYAFVQYTNDADAKKALKEAQGTTLNGRTIRCEPARVNRTLFISYKDRSPNSHGLVSAAAVNLLLEKFGELEQLVACRDPYSHKKNKLYSNSSRSNAWFIQFAYRDDAIRAFANLKTDFNWVVEWAQNIEAPSHMNMLSDKKNLTIPEEAEAQDSDACEPITNHHHHHHQPDQGNVTVPGLHDVIIDQKSIFVGQLDPMATEEKLLKRFSRHGSITDINLITKPNNVFAFIKFTTEEAAAAALEMENHAIFLSKTMHVQYREIGGIKRFRRGNQHHHNRNNYFGNGTGAASTGSVHSSSGQNNINYNGGGPSIAYAGVYNTTENSQEYNLAPYQPPRLSLAPPPINVGKRRSSTGTNNYNHHYPHYPLGHEFQPFTPQSHQISVVGPKKLRSNSRHKSVEITESNNDIPNNTGTNDKIEISAHDSGNLTALSYATDPSSENSEPTGNNDKASDVSTSHYTTSAGGVDYKKKVDEYKKRGSYPTFDPYFYPPYYYPMEFPMGRNVPTGRAAGSSAPLAGPAVSSRSGHHQPYFMYYPLPQGNAIDYTEMHNMMVPHIGRSPGPIGTPIISMPLSQQQYMSMETD